MTAPSIPRGDAVPFYDLLTCKSQGLWGEPVLLNSRVTDSTKKKTHPAAIYLTTVANEAKLTERLSRSVTVVVSWGLPVRRE